RASGPPTLSATSTTCRPRSASTTATRAPGASSSKAGSFGWSNGPVVAPRPRSAMPRSVLLMLAVLAVLPAPVVAAGNAAPSLASPGARAAAASADREKLRQDLLAFRRANYGKAEAVEAAELLARLPSPLDRLDPATIPALDRFDWQPKELV